MFTFLSFVLVIAIASSVSAVSSWPVAEGQALRLPTGGPGPAPAWASAYVDASGAIQAQSGTFTLNTTRISQGHYCFGNSQPPLGWANYASVLVTPQNSGIPTQLPGFASANTGYGDKCNPYGYAVYTFDVKGRAADTAFSLHVILNY